MFSHFRSFCNRIEDNRKSKIYNKGKYHFTLPTGTINYILNYWK